MSTSDRADVHPAESRAGLIWRSILVSGLLLLIVGLIAGGALKSTRNLHQGLHWSVVACMGVYQLLASLGFAHLALGVRRGSRGNRWRVLGAGLCILVGLALNLGLAELLEPAFGDSARFRAERRKVIWGSLWCLWIAGVLALLSRSSRLAPYLSLDQSTRPMRAVPFPLWGAVATLGLASVATLPLLISLNTQLRRVEYQGSWQPTPQELWFPAFGVLGQLLILLAAFALLRGRSWGLRLMGWIGGLGLAGCVLFASSIHWPGPGAWLMPGDHARHWVAAVLATVPFWIPLLGRIFAGRHWLPLLKVSPASTETEDRAARQRGLLDILLATGPGPATSPDEKLTLETRAERIARDRRRSASVEFRDQPGRILGNSLLAIIGAQLAGGFAAALWDDVAGHGEVTYRALFGVMIPGLAALGITIGALLNLGSSYRGVQWIRVSAAIPLAASLPILSMQPLVARTLLWLAPLFGPVFLLSLLPYTARALAPGYGAAPADLRQQMHPCHPSLWLAVFISLLAGFMLALLLSLLLVKYLSFSQWSTVQFGAHLAITVCWLLLLVPALGQLLAGSSAMTARPMPLPRILLGRVLCLVVVTGCCLSAQLILRGYPAEPTIPVAPLIASTVLGLVASLRGQASRGGVEPHHL